MRHDKLERELNLLLLLIENRQYTVKELCDRVGVTPRNLYYYLDFFRLAGFRLIKSGTRYRLDRRSKFFRKLHQCIDFTEDEAVYLRQMMQGANHSNPLVRSISSKLEQFYDLDILSSDSQLRQHAQHVHTLYDAIKLEQLVKIHGYSSPHSGTVSDRVIEPFQLLNNNADVRGFELQSGQCKTYKIARMQQVELIDLLWSNAERHEHLKTDVFMFSGKETFEVEIIMGQLSCNLFKEEYPQAAHLPQPLTDGRWQLKIEVCSYKGIGRFVLGLFNDIKVIGSAGFIDYLRDQIAQMKV